MKNLFIKFLLLPLIFLPSTLLADTNEYIIGADAPMPAAVKQPVTTALEVLWDGQFEAGHRIATTVRLRNIATGNILTNSDIKYTGGDSISFFLIDPSMTDYQKPKLERSDTPYVFNFSFVPKFSTSYRLWVITTPNSSGKEEALGGWIGKEEPSFTNRKLSYKTVMNGYIFTLSSDIAPAAGSSCIININVTDQNNKPVQSQAQAVSPLAMEYNMREPNSVIGFYDDFQNIIHAYEYSETQENNNTILNMPNQDLFFAGQMARTAAAASNGPDFRFKIQPKQIGFVKLFAHLKINGKDMVVPFSFYINK